MPEKDYSATVNLPRTNFSMKANLAQKEPEIIRRWEKIGLYQKLMDKRANAKSHILHDGPPYANGEIHLGTALNKIVKDIINKYKSMRGFRTPYVPGWDCHGLPIELKVVEQLGEKAGTIPRIGLRNECRKYAEKFVKIQKQGFQRLGVLADWENPYLTLSGDYESAIMEGFGKLFEKGHIYRGLRPVHWCVSCATSLAEAEIEYHDHGSPSIYVRFPVVKHSIAKLSGKPLFVMIWTTTPWTLPANTGLSFHPEETYVAAMIDGSYSIVAEKLLGSVLAARKLTAGDVIPLSKADLESLSVKHPWIDRESRVVFGRHVTMDTGTGIVHTAPGHGMEDYQVGLEYGLEQLSPVDDRGRFTQDVPEFAGMNVFEANPKVIEFLDEKGLLYLRQDITHSYPHCWRCKNPIIFRSKPQWFFRVSDAKLAEKALAELPKVRWIPEWGEQRIRNMLSGRPDWCLSRQRNWGVPIPAFYCEECNETLLNRDTLAHVIGIVKTEGVDVWFRREAAELLPEGTVCPKCGGTHFKKETDILDVWFDSGVSSLAVLEKRKELSSPADVYLEGSDQYRGWFQASLWPAVAINGRAPFKTVVTHGWVLDEQGRQMHKSLGNSISPKEVYDKFGADVLRLWVVTEDYRGDLRFGENLIQKSGEAYRKIRNTFRFLLGNIDGFDAKQSLPYNELIDVDRYALHMLAELRATVERHYENFEFHKAFRELYNFCSVELSSFYLDVLKDRLYIYPKTSCERLSAQTTANAILEHLVLMLAPILPFTMEEIWLSRFCPETRRSDDPLTADSIHLQLWKDIPSEWMNEALAKKFVQIEKVRETALKAIETLRSTKGNPIGSGLEAKLTIQPKDAFTADVLKEYADSLRYFFIVSEVTVAGNMDRFTIADETAAVLAERADGAKCARCWNYSTHIDADELCERCGPIVKAL